MPDKDFSGFMRRLDKYPQRLGKDWKKVPCYRMGEGKKVEQGNSKGMSVSIIPNYDQPGSIERELL